MSGARTMKILTLGTLLESIAGMLMDRQTVHENDEQHVR